MSYREDPPRVEIIESYTPFSINTFRITSSIAVIQTAYI